VDHKKSYTLFLIGLVITMVILLAAVFTEIYWLAIPAFVILFAALIQAGLFLRCPHCGVGLRVKGGRPKFCRECGTKIDWE
jgi:DNA-directed RNA polymerase subunit RPC12/RpoP